MKILVLGAGGMLGSACYQVFAENEEFLIYGTLRTLEQTAPIRVGGGTLIPCVNALELSHLAYVFDQCSPDVVINCVGIIKQLDSVKNLPLLIETNALLPHRLADLSNRYGARLIHISTDCETLASNAITLRTSIIGHEVKRAVSLVDWFLSQRGSVKGYRRAIFSGLPSVELARVIRDYVVPDREMTGLYHVAAEPIAKFDLLGLVAKEYRSEANLVPDDTLVIDRSLDGQRFRERTGYVAASWPTLVRSMRQHHGNATARAA